MVKRLVKAVGASAVGAVLLFGTPAPAQAAVNWHYVRGFFNISECSNRGIAGAIQGNWVGWQCRQITPSYWELWADDQCRICLASVEAVRVED